MFYTIYQITNLTDGKIYIGKHQAHKLDDGYMGSGKILSRAIKKHGRENFKKEILHVFDTEAEMNAKEADLVNEEFVARKDTYNICFGGQGGFGYINQSKLSVDIVEQHRRNPDLLGKMSTSSKEAIARLLETDENFKNRWLQQCSVGGKIGGKTAFLGRRHTEETKDKMRKPKNMGATNSQFGTRWITNGHENRKIAKEQDLPEGWRNGRINGQKRTA